MVFVRRRQHSKFNSTSIHWGFLPTPVICSGRSPRYPPKTTFRLAEPRRGHIVQRTLWRSDMHVDTPKSVAGRVLSKAAANCSPKSPQICVHTIHDQTISRTVIDTIFPNCCSALVLCTKAHTRWCLQLEYIYAQVGTPQRNNLSLLNSRCCRCFLLNSS